MIYRKSSFKNIILCDENHISFIQVFILLAWFSNIRIDYTAVIPSSLNTSTFIISLNFNIVYTVFPIHCKNIQPHRFSL